MNNRNQQNHNYMFKATTYITAKIIQEQYEFSTSTTRNWENEGKIESKKTPGGKRLYNSNDIDQFFLTKNSVSPSLRFIMPESAMSTKKETSKYIYKTLERHIPTRKSSVRLQVVSTSQERNLTPFSKEHSKELSQKLWLLTETDCVDLDSKSLSRCSSILRSK